MAIFKFKLRNQETGAVRLISVFAKNQEQAKIEATRIAQILKQAAASRERKTTA